MLFKHGIEVNYSVFGKIIFLYGVSFNPLMPRRFSKNCVFLFMSPIFASLFISKFLIKYLKPYHHSIANFTKITKIGLFFKSSGQNFEISSNICNTVDLGHLRPVGVKGLKTV